MARLQLEPSFSYEIHTINKSTFIAHLTLLSVLSTFKNVELGHASSDNKKKITFHWFDMICSTLENQMFLDTTSLISQHKIQLKVTPRDYEPCPLLDLQSYLVLNSF